MHGLIAQASQASEIAMKSWGPAEWTLFFGAVGGFITLLTTSIIAIIKAREAQATSAQNTQQNTQTASAVVKMAEAVDPTMPEKGPSGIANVVRSTMAPTTPEVTEAMAPTPEKP